MANDSVKHDRKSLRLEGYDYNQAGAYFVTICVHKQEFLFGRAEEWAVRLSKYGRIAEQCWAALPRHFTEIRLDFSVVMPNHIHGIILIGDGAGGGRCGGKSRGEAFARPIAEMHPSGRGSFWPQPVPARANASPLRPQGTTPGSLGAIVQNFKAVTARKINRARGTPGIPVWQRNYYEHIVRNEEDLNRIRQYIIDNPGQWENDENNPVVRA